MAAMNVSFNHRHLQVFAAGLTSSELAFLDEQRLVDSNILREDSDQMSLTRRDTDVFL
jgi:hypothetical protein